MLAEKNGAKMKGQLCHSPAMRIGAAGTEVKLVNKLMHLGK